MNSQRGLTIIELLVAVVVFTIVFIAALTLYTTASRAYIQMDASTVQQQNTRFAFDRMLETLRDAGANTNPMGKSTFADEQIEGAWESAIVVRGDFDNLREVSLETSSNLLVTTGNHDVVGFALMKSGANAEDLEVKLDVDRAGGRTTLTAEEQEKTLDVAALTLDDQGSPPYELHRITFKEDGSFETEVIAENIFRLEFTYYDEAGNEIAPPGGADDARDERASIRRIGVKLITMSDRPDFGYVDSVTYTPAEGTDTKNRRKFTMAETVLASNLGVKGGRHSTHPAVDIEAPATLTVCTGHHNYFYLFWDEVEDISTYKISISATSPDYDGTEESGTNSFTWKAADATQNTYTFSVAGYSGSYTGDSSPEVEMTLAHDTTNSRPVPPENVVGGAGDGYSLRLRWDQTQSSATPLNGALCTSSAGGPTAATPPWNTAAPDVEHYRVYRGISPVLANGDALVPNDTTNRVDTKNLGGTLANTAEPTSTEFVDKTAAPCGQYFYKVKAYDTADLTAAGNGSVGMAAPISFVPDASIKPGTPDPPAPTGAVTVAGTTVSVTLNWDDVLVDNAGNPAFTAHYQLIREEKIGSSGSWGPSLTRDYYEQPTQMPAPDVLPTTSGTNPISYRYAVAAIYDCGDVSVTDNDRISQSDWYNLTCTPPGSHTITITTPAAGTVVARPVESGFNPAVSLLPVSGSTWSSITVDIEDPDGNSVTGYPKTDSAAPFNAFGTFNGDGLEEGTYTVKVTGTTSAGCVSAPVERTFEVTDDASCLTLVNSSLQPTNGPNGNRRKQLQFQLQNVCDTSVTFNKLKLTWSGGVNDAATRLTAINTPFGNTAVANAVSGTDIPLAAPMTINAGVTSGTITIVYSHQMMGTTWSSIEATLSSPDVVPNETLSSSIAPNN